MHVNGFLDLEASVHCFEPFTNSQLVLGQYRSIPSFTGTVSNLLLFLYPVTGDEV